MKRSKIASLIATTLVLLGIDVLVGVSRTLYMGAIAGFGLVGFIVAVLRDLRFHQPVACALDRARRRGPQA